MPPGPPPYPVTYKQFFITDPRTGKQTMKIQMIPAGPSKNGILDHEDPYYQYYDDEDSEEWDSDMADHDEGYLMNYLEQYYEAKANNGDYDQDLRSLYGAQADYDSYWGEDSSGLK